MTGRRVTLVTAGHLATCPRMVKAADAMHGAGYDVRVISVQHTSWARSGDAAIRRTRSWRWQPIECGRSAAPGRWLTSGFEHRGAAIAARALGDASPASVVARAFSRVHAPLVDAILREPADLIYGGTSGALAAAAEAGRRSGTPFAVDFEDFHCGEEAEPSDRNGLAEIVMRDVVRDAAFVTAGSAAIARACDERFGRRAVPIHNVFALPDAPPPVDRRDDPPGLYWFSQTIGPGRGLEDVVSAMGRLGAPCELHLRGVSANGYADRLRAHAATTAPRMHVHVHAPADPDTMVDACRPFAIGLATEPGHTPNSALLLSNKALTYPLAGLPVVVTNTPGQRSFASDLGEGAVAYVPGDLDGLAASLHAWTTNARACASAGDASWDAARRRWHWEHAEERGALLACVERAIA